ncbi:hypothetical protein AB0B85_23865 [Micromonospora sp. NPDC049044]|uniref:hypothetical protein n=1 Tax=unclassified Micromonospora TaxID=2617518 RepID=UPI0033D52CED
MIRIVNSVGDRLLGFVAPKATASAADCGPIERYEFRCYNGVYQRRGCFARPGCACTTWVVVRDGC